MPILDAIPVNWFILGTSILAGVILFLILTQIPDEEENENTISNPRLQQASGGQVVKPVTKKKGKK